MKKILAPNFKSPAAVEVQVANLRMADFTAEAASPFASLGLKPDLCKAYLEFDICQSLPATAGPVQSDNMVGYFPTTLAQSYASLVHQQFNLRHMLKAYAPKPKPGEPAVARDRIVGCVVAAHFPKPPMGGGWMTPANEKGATACIRALAVVFKLAEGVPKMLGEHLASRVKQGVSIECTTDWDNIGVWRPSTRQLAPLMSVPEDMMPAIQFEDAKGVAYPGLPHVGKIDGEQLVVVYGSDDRPIQFQGVGMTPRPAEKTSRIVSMSAERGDEEMVAMSAEEAVGTLVGRSVRFATGRIGNVREVKTEGTAYCHGFRLKATPENPVLHIVLGRDEVMLSLAEVGERLDAE